MTIEEAIQKSAEALKGGVHEDWIIRALVVDGIHPIRVPVVIRWVKQINLKRAQQVKPFITI